MTRVLREATRAGQFADAMNEGTKTPVESKTLWGAVALLLAWALGQAGVQEDAARISEELGRAADAVRTLLATGGFVLTVWGRFAARKRIQVSPDADPGE